MFVEAFVPSCDITDTVYAKPVKGAYALAQGATGRWCCVMYVGPEYLEEKSIKVLTRDEAEAKCEAIGGEIDF